MPQDGTGHAAGRRRTMQDAAGQYWTCRRTPQDAVIRRRTRRRTLVTMWLSSYATGRIKRLIDLLVSYHNISDLTEGCNDCHICYPLSNVIDIGNQAQNICSTYRTRNKPKKLKSVIILQAISACNKNAFTENKPPPIRRIRISEFLNLDSWIRSVIQIATKIVSLGP